MEDQFVHAFFELVSNLNTIPSVTEKEWFLTTSCFDELSYRREQTSFFCITGLSLWAGKRFFVLPLKNWCVSVYLGLVSYDLALQRQHSSAAARYWASVCTLNSDLGREARRIYTPFVYPLKVSLTTDTKSLSKALFQAILLQNWFHCVLEGSCFHQSSSGSDSKLTRLRISSNYLRWDVIQSLSDNSQQKFEFRFSPAFHVNQALSLSGKNRNILLSQMSFVGKCWYGIHFAIVDRFKKLGIADGVTG